MKCPRCGSTHVSKREAGKRTGATVVGLSAAAIGTLSAMRGAQIGMTVGLVAGRSEPRRAACLAHWWRASLPGARVALSGRSSATWRTSTSWTTAPATTVVTCFATRPTHPKAPPSTSTQPWSVRMLRTAARNPSRMRPASPTSTTNKEQPDGTRNRVKVQRLRTAGRRSISNQTGLKSASISTAAAATASCSRRRCSGDE